MKVVEWAYVLLRIRMCNVKYLLFFEKVLKSILYWADRIRLYI